MTYTDYIKNYIGQQQPGEPIFTEMVSDKVAVAFGLDKKKGACRNCGRRQAHYG